MATTTVPFEMTAATTEPTTLLPQGIVSREEFYAINIITNYMVYPLCVVGVLFCVFSVIVYSSKTMRSATSIYLVALNLTELANVVLLIGEETVRLFYGKAHVSSYFPLNFALFGGWYIGTSMRRCTYAISLLLSAERFIAVAYPLRSKYFKLVRYPLATVLLTILILHIFHVFIIFRVEIVPMSAAPNETSWVMIDSEDYTIDRTLLDTFGHIGITVFVYMALAGCFFCNTLIAVSLKRHSRTRRELCGSNEGKDGAVGPMREKDKRTTWIILGSTCALALLALPTNITSSLVEVPDFGPGADKRERYLFHTLIRIGRVCELISNCCGFVFYITLSLQFRRTFVEKFCKASENNKQTTITHSSSPPVIKTIAQPSTSTSN